MPTNDPNLFQLSEALKRVIQAQLPVIRNDGFALTINEFKIYPNEITASNFVFSTTLQ